jgi:anti-sigma regulatory factor (Ser/Thr protein kinase)
VFVVHALNLGGSVEIEVRDFGFWRPPRAGTDRGRGLELMKRLTDSMKVVPGSEGTTVHLVKSVRVRKDGHARSDVERRNQIAGLEAPRR